MKQQNPSPFSNLETASEPLARVHKLLRSILAGNGVDPHDLQLEDAQIAPLTFTAHVHIKLTAQIARRQVPGRDMKGDMVPDEHSFSGAIDRYLTGLIAQPGPRKAMTDLLLKRPDQGFGFDDKAISFKSLAHTFVAYNGCAQCHRSGQLPCSLCNGRKRTRCTQCNGQRNIPCQSCHGSGQKPNEQGTCSTCHGSGRTPCPSCQETGETPCRNCMATGQIKCRFCNGTGWTSTLLIAEPEAQYRFSLDTRPLPPGSETVIRRHGPALLTKGHAKIAVSRIATTIDDPEIPPGEILVSYQGTMPWGPVRFTLGTMTISAIFYGQKGALYECPPFLERRSGEIISALVTAAQNRQAAGDILPKIAQMRFIRDALQASLLRVRAKAIQQYKARYPYGISDQMIRDMLALAEAALRSASFIFRLYGALGGIGTSAAILAAYYLGPGLIYINAQHQPPAVQAAIEFFFVLSLMIFVYQIPRLAGAYALKRILGGVMPIHKLQRLMPHAGFVEWGTVLTIPLLTTAMIIFLKTSGGVIPAWLHTFGL